MMKKDGVLLTIVTRAAIRGTGAYLVGLVLAPAHPFMLGLGLLFLLSGAVRGIE